MKYLLILMLLFLSGCGKSEPAMDKEALSCQQIMSCIVYMSKNSPPETLGEEKRNCFEHGSYRGRITLAELQTCMDSCSEGSTDACLDGPCKEEFQACK